MFIPLSTDAPVYHWPWATASLIGSNVAAFALHAAGLLPGGDEWAPWAMQFGTGLRPLQWVTCHFVHFDLLHLVGNMLFLWIFGLVVEGKIGWLRYLLVFFGVGAAQALAAQLLMLATSDPRPAGGASGVVFGLMAISLVWAPKNEVSLIGLIWYRGVYFEMTILALSGFYFAMQAAFALAGGFAMSSAVLHLLGAAAGLSAGVLMLKRGWVDCENWDLFAVLAGTYGSPAVSDDLYFRDEALQARLREGALPPPAEKSSEADSTAADEALAHMRYCLDSGRPAAALAEYRHIVESNAEFRFDSRDLRRLAESLCEARLWREAGPLLEQFVESFPEDASLRLKLAALLVEIEHRPQYALRVLDGLPASGLDERLLRRRGRIEARARRMIDEGVLELEGRAWQ